MKQRYDSSQSYLPAVVDDIPVSARYEPSQTLPETAGWSGIVVSANILFALILAIGMIWDGRNIIVSIIAGGIYYAATTISVIALISGQAATMWRNWQQERTERHRIDAYEYLGEQKLKLDAMPATHSLPAEGAQGDDADPLPSYVPAYTDEAVSEAFAWLYGLYGRDGRLRSNRVRGGYVQGSVVGSRRAGGSEAAKHLLIANQVIRRAEGGYRFNWRRYPTVAEVDELKRRLHPVPGG